MTTAVCVLVAVVFCSLALRYTFDLTNSYKNLPEKVASQFDFKGVANGSCLSPRAWAVLSVSVIVWLTAQAVFILLRLDTGNGVWDIVAQILGACIAFGGVYSAFTQVLRINTSRQERLSMLHLLAWALGMPVVVFLAVMASITLKR